MRLTRRQAIAGAAAGALGASGIYELVDKLAGDSPPRAATGPLPPEQHILDGQRVITDNGVDVIMPPLHHRVLTAKVKVGLRDLRDAQRGLEDVLARLEARYGTPSPAGLGVTVAWGLPYFDGFVSDAWKTHAPFDRRAQKPALLPTRSFQSDPDSTVLEHNDVAILLRSDQLAHIDDAAEAVALVGVFEITSIRKGFVGGGLPKQLALAANIPGADLIPDGAELFLGFTSTQAQGLGPRKIANFETLGYVELGPRSYFREGTHMHLSHISENLEAWYVNFDFKQRVDTAFRPHLDVKDGTQTVRQAPEDVATAATVSRDFDTARTIGHSASIQTASRLQQDHVAEDGTVYPKGTAIPHRADLNTLDNPFFFPAEAAAEPQAGVHFVVFNPTSDDFNRNRLAMDGVLPDGKKLPFLPRQRGQGFNDVLRTTHRQNFLVPPRRHRSFPLAEIRVG
jgi:hypothetical protein